MSEPRFSPELLALIQASLPEHPVLLSQEILADLDWNKMGKLAHWHQVRPLLFEVISEEGVPEKGIKFYKHLKEFAFGQAVANMAFLGLSVKLYEHLKIAGVQAFPMKGALWSWMFYAKPTSREFGDIDYFIKKEDVQKSLNVLADSGFYPDDYRLHLMRNKKLAEAYLDTDYQLPLEPADVHTLQSLEIQWNVSYPRYCYNLRWDDLAADRMDFQLLHSSVQVPKMENQLLMMIVHHGGVEQWDKLKYLADLVRLLRKSAAQLDWNHIAQIARSRGFYKLLVQSLHLVQALTGENYHKMLGAHPANQSDPEFYNTTVAHWENPRPAPKTKTRRILAFNLKYRDDWKCKLSILGAHISYFLRFRLIVAKAKWYRSNRF